MKLLFYLKCLIDILKCKRIEARDTVTELNKLKKELDECKEKLDDAQATRQREDQIEDGEEPIIDEEEFLLLKKIGGLKLSYRKNFEALQNLRSDVTYCENLVDQCRKRLVSEFQAWYADCFMPVTEEFIKREDTKIDDLKNSEKVPEHGVNEEEKIEKLKVELLLGSPDSVPFYNAKSQTERRKLYTGSHSGKRKPGDISTNIRNKPPSSLTVK